MVKGYGMRFNNTTDLETNKEQLHAVRKFGKGIKKTITSNVNASEFSLRTTLIVCCRILMR